MQDCVSPEHQIERLQFRRAPLAAAALCFAFGILLVHLAPHETIQIVTSLGILAFLALVSLRNRVGTLAVVAVWIALGVAAATWQQSPPAQTKLLAYADNLSRDVRAHVLRVRIPPPEEQREQSADADATPPWEAAEDTSQQRGHPVQVDLAIDEIEQVTPDTSTMIPVSGGIRVSVYKAGETFSLHCGDRIELPLRLKPPDYFRTPGAFDDVGYLLAQGIAAHANASASAITRVQPGSSTLRCRLFAAQQTASTRLIALADSPANQRLPSFLRLSQPDARMLNAMLFGDRSGLNHTLRTEFERTGTFHLFVVSGLHIALVAAGLFWLLRRLRFPIGLATVLTIAGTGAYAALTGFGQPAQRALTMTAVFLVSRLLSRDRDVLNALGAAGLTMLLLAPSSLFDASFQMTVLVIIGIAGIAIPLAQRTPIRNAPIPRFAFTRPRRIFIPRQAQLLVMLELWGDAFSGILGRWSEAIPARSLTVILRFFELALISLVVELVMVLPMAVYFHRLPVFAVPANIIILPAIGVLVPAALLTFVLSLLSVKVALVPAIATASLLHGISFAVKRLTTIEGSDLRIPGPVWQVALAAIVCWIVCAWLVRRSRIGALVAALALPVIATCILYPELPDITPKTLEITAIDVGQGDSILAINPEGQTMLIDAGGPIGSHGSSANVASFDVGEQVVAPYLWSRRLRRLDIVVLTHAHTDHMGGMPAILEDLRPRELWVGIDPDSSLYRGLLTEANSLGIPVHHVHAGDRRSWGSVEIVVLAPQIGYKNPSAPRNDDSVVLHLQFGQSSVLLEGDAERFTEDTMLGAGLISPVTLLKVGHHGSKTSSNPEFLAAAHPRDAIVSVGRNNPFGHPKAEVIERFAEARTKLFRTDEFGTTTFRLTRDGHLDSRLGDLPSVWHDP